MSIRSAKHGEPAWVCRPLMAKRVHSRNMFADVAEIVRATRLLERVHKTRAVWGRMHRWFGHIHLRNGRRSREDELTGCPGSFAMSCQTWEPCSDVALAAQLDPKDHSWRTTAKSWLRELDARIE